MKLSFLFWIFHLFSLSSASESSSTIDNQIHLTQPSKQLKSKDKFFGKNLNTKIVHPSVNESKLVQSVDSGKDAGVMNVVPETIRFNKLFNESISGEINSSKVKIKGGKVKRLDNHYSEDSLETLPQVNYYDSSEKLEPQLPKSLKRPLSESAVISGQTGKKALEVINESKDLKNSENSAFEELLRASISKALKFDLKGMSYSLNNARIDSSAPKDEVELFNFLKDRYVAFKELDPKNKSDFHKFTFRVLEEFNFTDAGFLEYLGFRTKDPNSNARSCQFAKLCCQQIIELFQRSSKNPKVESPTDFKILEWREKKGEAKFFKYYGGYILILSLLNDIITGELVQKIKPVDKSQLSSKVKGTDNDPFSAPDPKKTFEDAIKLDHNTFRRALHEYCETKKFDGALNGPDFKSFFDHFKDIYCEVYYPEYRKFTYRTWAATKIIPLSNLIRDIITYELNIPFEDFLESLGFTIPNNYNLEENGYAGIVYPGLKKWFDVSLLKGLDPKKYTHFISMRGPLMLGYVYFQDFRKKAGRMATKKCQNPGIQLPNNLEISQPESLENSSHKGLKSVETSNKIATKNAKKTKKSKRSSSKVQNSKKSKSKKRSSLKVETKKRKVKKLDNHDINRQVDIEESIDGLHPANYGITPEKLESQSPKHLKRSPSESLVNLSLKRTKALKFADEIEIKNLKNSESPSSGNSRVKSENDLEIENFIDEDLNMASEEEEISPADIEALHEEYYKIDLQIQKILQSQGENVYMNPNYSIYNTNSLEPNSIINPNESAPSHFQIMKEGLDIPFIDGFENSIVSQPNLAVDQKQDNQESFENAFAVFGIF